MTTEAVARDIKRHERAKARKEPYIPLIQEGMSYGVQNRDTFYKQSEGQKNQNEAQVFDSTAPAAVSKFVSNLQSSLVPPMKTWVKLRAGALVPENTRGQSDIDLQKVNDTMFANLQNSNFDTQIAEAFHDLAVSTGALLLQPGTRSNPFVFTAVPLSQLSIEELADSRPGAVFREHEVFVTSIKELWADAIVPSEVSQMAKDPGKDKIMLREMTLPEKVKVLEHGANGKLSYVTVDGYRYTVIAGEHRIVERTQRSSPWIIFRWSVVPGEIYGRGPVITHLADIKTLNKTTELTLKNAAMAVAGAYTVVDDGVININTMRVYPGAKIPVSSNGGSLGPSIQRLETAGNFDVSQLIKKELQRAINDGLFADPLGPIDLPVKSATEMSLRQQELAKRIGSAFGRLQYELIAPLVNRMLHILEEFGLIDIQNYRVDGQIIAIQHVSPLALAQDEENLMALMRWVQFMRDTYGPEILMILCDPKTIGQAAGKMLNVPADLLPSDEQWAQVKSNVVNFASRLAQQGAQPQMKAA